MSTLKWPFPQKINYQPSLPTQESQGDIFSDFLSSVDFPLSTLTALLNKVMKMGGHGKEWRWRACVGGRENTEVSRSMPCFGASMCDDVQKSKIQIRIPARGVRLSSCFFFAVTPFLSSAKILVICETLRWVVQSCTPILLPMPNVTRVDVPRAYTRFYHLFFL